MGRDPLRATSFVRASATWLALVILAAPAALHAQGPAGGWVGKRVVGKARDFALRDEKGIVKGSRGNAQALRVVRVQGPDLWLRDDVPGGVQGRARAADVVPLDQAIDYFSRMIRARPDDGHGYYMRASVRLDLKEHLDLALKDCDALVRLNPRTAECHGLRGACRMARGELDEAIADFNEAIRLDPKEVLYYFNRGASLAKKHEYDKALADLDLGLKIDPKSPTGYASRAATWTSKGDFDKAIADWTKAIQLDPGSAQSYLHRGRAWSAKGDDARAIADFDAALKLDPKNLTILLLRGVARLSARQYDEAILDFNAALKLNPNFAYTYTVLAAARTQKKEYAAALADIDRAIRLDPKISWSYYGRAVIALLTGRDDEADVRAVIERDGWNGPWSVAAALIGHFAAQRAKHDAAARRLLDDAVKGADKAAWPYPVIRFLRAEIDEKALLALANDDRARTKAHCYLGLDHLLAGRTAQAREHFRWVKEHGVTSDTEYLIAVAELDRLEAKPRP